MPPHLAAFLIPTIVLCISFASFYLNIESAKRRLSVWKRGSTYMFIRSNGVAGIKRRAKLVWMKELGYDEREAMMLAGCQARATVLAFLSSAVVSVIAASFVRS